MIITPTSNGKGHQFVAFAVIFLVVCLAQSALSDEEAFSSCSGIKTREQHEQQLTVLSKLIDPSGALSKIINDYVNEHKTTDCTAVKTPETSSTEAAAAAATTTTATVTSSASPVASEATKSEPAIKANELAVTDEGLKQEVPAVASSEQNNSTEAAATSTTKLATPVVVDTSKAPATSSQQNNVTVNVFLELAPDAATDQMIANPNGNDTTSSTAATPVAAASNLTSAETSSESAQQASTTKQAELDKVSEKITTLEQLPTPVPVPATTENQININKTANETAAAAPPPPAEVEAEKQNKATVAKRSVSNPTANTEQIIATSSGPTNTTTSNQTTTTTTTTATPSTSTTTEAVPSPSSTTTTATTLKAPEPELTPSSTTTTTTTPTTTHAPTVKTTPTTTTTTTTQAPVEISASDLASLTNSNSSATDEPTTIEIIISSSSTIVDQTNNNNATSATTTTTTKQATPDATSPSTASASTTDMASSTTSTTTTPAPISSSTTQSITSPSTPASSPSATETASSTTTSTTTSLAPKLEPSTGATQAKVEQTPPMATMEKQKQQDSMATVPAVAPNGVGPTIEPGMVSEDMREIVRASNDPSLSAASTTDNSQQQPMVSTTTATTTTTTTVSPLDDLLMNEIVSSSSKGSSNNSGLVSVVDDFSNFEKTEPEDYATCQFKPIITNNINSNVNNINNNDHGIINMWQTSNGRGPLHIHARLGGIFNQTTSTITGDTNSTNSSQQQQQQQQQQSSSLLERVTRSIMRVINKRESYQAPVERESEQQMMDSNVNGQDQQNNNSININNKHGLTSLASEATSTSISSHRQTTRHEIWLHHSASSSTGSTDNSGGCEQLGDKITFLSEIRSDARTGEVDAEIIVPHLNLTGSNTITNNYIVVYSAKPTPQQKQHQQQNDNNQTRLTQVPIGCCLVRSVDKLPSSDDSSSLLQPIPESALRLGPNNPNLTSTISSSATTPTITSLSPNSNNLINLQQNNNNDTFIPKINNNTDDHS